VQLPAAFNNVALRECGVYTDFSLAPLRVAQQNVGQQYHQVGIAVVVPGEPHMYTAARSEEMFTMPEDQAVHARRRGQRHTFMHLLEKVGVIATGELQNDAVVLDSRHARQLQSLRQR
jgi:hypothetical protein